MNGPFARPFNWSLVNVRTLDIVLFHSKVDHKQCTDVRHHKRSTCISKVLVVHFPCTHRHVNSKVDQNHHEKPVSLDGSGQLLVVSLNRLTFGSSSVLFHSMSPLTTPQYTVVRALSSLNG